MAEDIIVQLAVTIVGGFVLNLLWSIFVKRMESKSRRHVLRLKRIKLFLKRNGAAHPVITKCIRGILCFLLMAVLLDVFTDIYRVHNKYDKEWIKFEWIVYEDSRIGNHLLSPNCNMYAQRGKRYRELVVRQVSDATLVQVYNTDFDMDKPNIFFSDNDTYVLVTEKKNVNLFHNISGELIDSFLIKDEKVEYVLFAEEEQSIFFVTSVGEDDCRISRYDMSAGEFTEDRFWENTLLVGETADLEYYLGYDFDAREVFAASLSDLSAAPFYGESALRLCTNGVSSFLFDKTGKYYMELSTTYSTRIEVKECAGGSIIYNTNVYNLTETFFDEQNQLYVVHQGYVDKIDLLTGRKTTVVDLSTIAERKKEKRVDEDAAFVYCCLISNSRYLAGIVYEPSSHYNRIYLIDMNTEEIVAMSNSLGEIAENGYARIVECNEALYAIIIGNNGNSAIYYPLTFDNERNLIF